MIKMKKILVWIINQLLEGQFIIWITFLILEMISLVNYMLKLSHIKNKIKYIYIFL